MNEPTLTARVLPGDDGRRRVVAPRVGWWLEHPRPGALVGPGSRIGALEHLNRRFALILPEGAAGRVAGGLPRDRWVAVEYGEVLFELSPLVSEEHAALREELRAVEGVAPGDLGEGTHAVIAPTDGVFYRSPAPGAPPFVEPGSRVVSGQPVGLVEVMKTFSQIVYGGPGLPEEAEIVEIRVADTAEVRAGSVLMVVR